MIEDDRRNLDPDVRLADVQKRQDEFAQQVAAFREAIHASLRSLDQPTGRAHRRLHRA
jgi:hypothetical protein